MTTETDTNGAHQSNVAIHFITAKCDKWQLSISTSYVLGYNLAVWLSGNALTLINVAVLRQTWLVPGWVTISVCNQPTMSTQPFSLRGTVN